MPARILARSFSVSILLTISVLMVYGQARRFSNGVHLPLSHKSTIRVENQRGQIYVTLTQRSDLELVAVRHGSAGPAVRSDEYVIEQGAGRVKITTQPMEGGIDLRLSLPED